MKLSFYSGLLLAAVVGGSMVSCDQLKDLSYSTTPNPLELHGDSVAISVTVNIPPKGIKKKISVEISPMLGNTKLSMWKIQGEKATGNGQSITFKPGGSATFTEVVAYDPSMEAADLTFTGKVFKGSKEKGKEAIPSTKLADATVITPLLVQKNFKVLQETNTIPRSGDSTKSANVNYLKGKSDVRANEMKDKDITELVSWLMAVQNDPKIKINSFEILAYASPDGEENFNKGLSGSRSRSARNAFIALMKANKLMQYTDSTMYSIEGLGEDLKGFTEELTANTTIQQDQKDLFLRVLSVGGQNDNKEKDIYALGKGFTQLEKDIFPKLRRSQISVKYTKQGLSDDELRNAAATTPASLNAEELLFVASSLTKDIKDQAKIYDAALMIYPTNSQMLNNSGAIALLQGNVSKAKTNLDKAISISDNANTKNNLAGVAMANGDRATAKKLLSQIKNSKAPEVGYNNAIIAILEGKYSSAVGAMSSASFNKALAQVLVGSLDDASKTLAASSDKETADGYYLKAIIAARSNAGVDAVVSNLKSAISKNAAYREKASKDREFIKMMEDATFNAAVK